MLYRSRSPERNHGDDGLELLSAVALTQRRKLGAEQAALRDAAQGEHVGRLAEERGRSLSAQGTQWPSAPGREMRPYWLEGVKSSGIRRSRMAPRLRPRCQPTINKRAD